MQNDEILGQIASLLASTLIFSIFTVFYLILPLLNHNQSDPGRMSQRCPDTGNFALRLCFFLFPRRRIPVQVDEDGDESRYIV